MNIPRNEYPRPQFVRSNWTNLNGEWDFSFESPTFDKTIVVPYVFQSKLSGIADTKFHDTVWYRRTFSWQEELTGKKLLLHFGAVDYECTLFINGKKVMHHVGGHINFTADITEEVQAGENEIVLKVFDPSTSLEIPRGKQFWQEESKSIFYTRSTGIWQTVWLEMVNETYLQKVWITPDLDRFAVSVRYEIAGQQAAKFEVNVHFKDMDLGTYSCDVIDTDAELNIALQQKVLQTCNFMEDLTWTPERPNLFDLSFTLYDSEGNQIDNASSYFGMRKVSVQNGRFLLNNSPYYQKLLLDQGYWEDSLLTAPDDGDFVKDIQMAKEMGFNGVRKHQKIEDPRFLYHADRLGFLVWGEIAAAYRYSKKYVGRITNEWMDAICRDYNHPSLVAWTPLNESWGVSGIKDNVEHQSHSAAMVFLTKSLDSTRPVISNDGWEHTYTDLLTIHDYTADKETLLKRYKDIDTILNELPSGRQLYANGWSYRGKEPVLVTEFGGISYQKSDWNGWGYSQATSDEDFAEKYYAVVSALLESPTVQGFCYTQITDVEQEINGLLTYKREYKVDPSVIKAINEGRWKPKR